MGAYTEGRPGYGSGPDWGESFDVLAAVWELYVA